MLSTPAPTAATVLVTGAAGFIGSHATEALLARGHRVVGLDNFNDYYPPERKRRNVEEVRSGAERPGDLVWVEGDIRDRDLVPAIFAEHRPGCVVHLAAMAGVRVSVDNPALYYDVNVQGTLNLLEQAHAHGTGNFVLASTSSVYGLTERIPFVEDDPCGTPISPYSASKRAAELMAFTFHHVHGLKVTALRFFTVYGPRGRPDMMAYKVLDSIDTGREIPLYNGGDMYRDWTYVGDIADGLVAAAERPLGFEILNLGRGEPVLLRDFVEGIEELTGKKANLVPRPMPDTDVRYTFADVSRAARLLGYDPKVSVREGLERFYRWYRSTRDPEEIESLKALGPLQD